MPYKNYFWQNISSTEYFTKNDLQLKNVLNNMKRHPPKWFVDAFKSVHNNCGQKNNLNGQVHLQFIYFVSKNH